MSDQEELSGYVDAWWQAIDDFIGVVETLPADAWSRPTDLPGWTVHGVVAHIAHLEHLSAGGQHDDIDVGTPEHAHGTMGIFTEQGVAGRREDTPDALITSLRSDTTRRHTALLSDPPQDGSAPAPGLFGAIGWSTRTLLRNRPLDVWMHEQDLRRAVGTPGGLDTVPADHTVAYLLESFGFTVAKRAKAPAGTTAVLRVTGDPAVAVQVTDAGRGETLPEVPAEPDVTLEMDRATYVVLVGGRRPAEPGAVEISGDRDLGERIVSVLATTP